MTSQVLRIFLQTPTDHVFQGATAVVSWSERTPRLNNSSPAQRDNEEQATRATKPESGDAHGDSEVEAPLYPEIAELYSTSHSGCHGVRARVRCKGKNRKTQRARHRRRRREHHPPDTMESLRYLGSMAGHKGWVTAIATSSENPDMILTASRGMCFPRMDINSLV